MLNCIMHPGQMLCIAVCVQGIKGACHAGHARAYRFGVVSSRTPRANAQTMGVKFRAEVRLAGLKRLRDYVATAKDHYSRSFDDPERCMAKISRVPGWPDAHVIGAHARPRDDGRAQNSVGAHLDFALRRDNGIVGCVKGDRRSEAHVMRNKMHKVRNELPFPNEPLHIAVHDFSSHNALACAGEKTRCHFFDICSGHTRKLEHEREVHAYRR